MFNTPGFVWDDAVNLPSGGTKPTLEIDATLVSDPGSRIAWKSRVLQVCPRTSKCLWRYLLDFNSQCVLRRIQVKT